MALLCLKRVVRPDCICRRVAKLSSCATCRARLVTGAISLKSNFALDDDELAAGYVLACQCLPESDDISLDFDVRL